MEFTKLVMFCLGLCVTDCATLGSNGYHCTFPTQWQSRVYMDCGAMIWIAEQMNATGTYFYDFPNQQMRLDISGYALGNYHFSFTFIWKFHEGAVYTIDNNNSTCDREADTIQVWNQWAGVPQDAVGLTFGGLGDYKVITARYSLLRNAGDTNAVVTLDVKEGSVCSPLRVSFQDEHLDPISGEMVNYEFLDAMPLSDPAVFRTPAHCANNTVQDHSFIRRLLPRRRFGLFMG
ncbi:uncharacterized protein LOC132554351 [Ylistrum balloti]|uniref:uncharacterized protein LOC132554351 n=1 Tax=Ylistrum balloti TaxID=509963 RepID=UPI002905D764|nr:uncharacterized protein LOC132554351 [Ylistrum balloti]